MAGEVRTSSIVLDKYSAQPGDTVEVQVMVTSGAWFSMYKEHLYFDNNLIHTWDGTIHFGNPTDTLHFTYTIPKGTSTMTHRFYARERSESIVEGKSADITIVAPPPPGQGSISFDTIPSGAAVVLDNTNTGRWTPCTVYASPGVHTYTLRKDGYELYNGQVAVAAGQTSHVRVNLVPTKGFDFTKILIIAGVGAILYYLVAKRERIAPYARAAAEKAAPAAGAAYGAVRARI